MNTCSVCQFSTCLKLVLINGYLKLVFKVLNDCGMVACYLFVEDLISSLLFMILMCFLGQLSLHICCWQYDDHSLSIS